MAEKWEMIEGGSKENLEEGKQGKSDVISISIKRFEKEKTLLKGFKRETMRIIMKAKQ